VGKLFTALPRLKEAAPFYTAFGWSGFSFELDDLRGTYILGDADLLQPNLTPDRKDGESAEERKRPAKPAQSGRWTWLARLRRAKSSAKAEVEQSLEATERMAIEETMSMATDRSRSNNGPTSTEDGNTVLAPAESISFRQEWRTRFRRWFTPESLEPETAVSAKTGEEPDGINLLFAYCPDAVPLYDEAGFPQLPPELIPLGRVHLTERVHPEAVEVVKDFIKAGVKIKILSADPPLAWSILWSSWDCKNAPRSFPALSWINWTGPRLSAPFKTKTLWPTWLPTSRPPWSGNCGCKEITWRWSVTR
jgi:hypothetical protein